MQANVLLKDYTTMRLGGPAKQLCTVKSREELVTRLTEAESQQLPVLVIGSGSNLIVSDKGFDGLVIVNQIEGFEIAENNESSVKIKVGAGKNWDEVVGHAVDLGLSGIENLSSIPGTTGAAPVQNIGAYGQEIADCLSEVEAYNLKTKAFEIISSTDCDFSYRKSKFNSTHKGQYIIVSVTLELSKKSLEGSFYTSLQKYLDKNNITDYSPASLRQAVVAIRADLLPDPARIPNTGSFFKNPIIAKWQVEELRRNFGNPPIFTMGENLFKLSAGWLIDEAGLKGFELGGMQVYDKNALVLVNKNNASYAELEELRDYIITTVRDKFRIKLEQEPESVGA